MKLTDDQKAAIQDAWRLLFNLGANNTEYRLAADALVDAFPFSLVELPPSRLKLSATERFRERDPEIRWVKVVFALDETDRRAIAAIYGDACPASRKRCECWLKSTAEACLQERRFEYESENEDP